MARGRQKLEITLGELQACINELEEENSFSNRTELYDAIAASPWSQSLKPRPLTPAVVIIRAKELGCTFKTPLGKRGRSKGEKVVSTNRKRKRIPLEMVAPLKEIFPESVHSKIDKAAAGSLKHAAGLKCLDCAGNSKREVGLCCITLCTLWGFRPYVHKLTRTPEGRKKIIDGTYIAPIEETTYDD